jgi:hypothetical protein
MKDEIMLTAEQVDAHIERFHTPNKVGFEAPSDKEAKTISLNHAFGKARPLLILLRSMISFKPKWQAVLDALIQSIDDLLKK